MRNQRQSTANLSYLWKNIQNFINTNQKEEFNKLCKENPSQMVHVIMTCRLSSPLYQKSKALTLDAKLQATLGPITPTNINALELALLQRRDYIAFIILQLLQQHSTPAQYKEFLNHQWGNSSNTALHLASFWGFFKIKNLILEMTVDTPPTECIQHTITKRPSFLLLKAEKQMSRLSIIAQPSSPLSFSSSSSTSSSSSFCWTPPASPIPTIIKEENRHFYEKEVHKPIVRPKKKKVRFDPQIMLLDTCMSGDKEELMDIINQYPVNLNEIRDLKNRSLLHIAFMQGHEHLLECLHDKVDINHPDQDGWTCLHYAAALGLWKSLEFLVSLSHCNVNARTNLGLKAQECPKTEFFRKRCKLIIERKQQLLSKHNHSRLYLKS